MPSTACGHDLARRIAERRKGPADRIDLLLLRDGLVLCQQLLGAGKYQRRRRQEHLVVDDAVHQRAELHLDRRHQEPDEGAAEHLRRQPDLVGGAHDADRIRRIGRDIDDVGIERLHRAHDRRIVGRCRRIFLVEHDLEAADFLDALARAVGGVLGEFGVGRDDRDGLRPRLLRGGQLEEAVSEGFLRLRPGRQHREILVVMEFAVGGIGQDADRGLVVLHQHRNCRRHHVGRVGADQQIDFVDVDQLGIDPGHVLRIALVVIEHQLDRTAEQAAFGVDVVAPDLQRRQHLLADRRHAAGERHAQADPDRLGGLRRARQQQDAHNSHERRQGARGFPHAQIAHVGLLPCAPVAGALYL